MALKNNASFILFHSQIIIANKSVLINKSMEIDGSDASNGSISGNQKNGLHLYPVEANASGEGFPYAPENWPNPGDKWKWKTGRRVATSGHFLDRYLYPPKHVNDRRGTRSGFASRQSVEHFVRKTFPDADLDTFFSSFSWRIPGKSSSAAKGWLKKTFSIASWLFVMQSS